MMRMWMRSCSSFQVHSSAMLSTSRMQLGGIQVTGGGKRSTPRTLAASVNTDLGVGFGRDGSPDGNMSATSLEVGQLWVDGVGVWSIHGPVPLTRSKVEDVSWVIPNGRVE